MKLRLLLSLPVLLFALVLRAESLPIANDTVWKDTQGEEIRAQGGAILRVNETWWWYGVDTDPGPDGRPVNRAVRCYSSTNLSRWQPQGQVLTEKVPARVQVARASGSKEWVLFLRDLLPPVAGADCTVRLAVATAPTGPFVETAPLSVPGSGAMNSFSVFQDDDGTAWLLFACERAGSEKARDINAVKLAPDLRKAAGPVQKLLVTEGEEPRMWKRDGKYYLSTAKTIDWVSSSAVYATADSPAGPWHDAGQRWGSKGRVTFDTDMSCIDGLLVVKGTEGSFLLYYGSRYPQFTTLGVGRNIMVPWDVDPKMNREALQWLQTWWLDVARGTWAKRKPGENNK